MNDQETISSRASLDTVRIEEAHHDDDLDTSSSTSESTSIISNPLQQAVALLCESIPEDPPITWGQDSYPYYESRKPNAQQENQQLVSLVSRMSWIEHQQHHESTTTRSMIDVI